MNIATPWSKSRGKYFAAAEDSCWSSASERPLGIWWLFPFAAMGVFAWAAILNLTFRLLGA